MGWIYRWADREAYYAHDLSASLWIRAADLVGCTDA